MGGTRSPDKNSLPRLLLLCGGRLAQGCHGWIESYREDALERGLLVPQGTSPAEVPVTLWSGRRVLLDPLGPFYSPAPGAPYGPRITEVASWGKVAMGRSARVSS
jgi:hypothetical protein